MIQDINDLKTECEKLLELIKEQKQIDEQWNEAINRFYQQKLEDYEKE
tara:strand:- start:72 stop:215 length:144 start_codon:yes stop_codon:yes gene_type:complete